MAGMESVYLKDAKHIPNRHEFKWCSKKVNLKNHFSEYANKMESIFPSTRCTFMDIVNAILPDEKVSKADMKSALEFANPRNFKNFHTKKEVAEESNHLSSSEEIISSISSSDDEDRSISRPNTSGNKGLSASVKAGQSTSLKAHTTTSFQTQPSTSFKASSSTLKCDFQGSKKFNTKKTKSHKTKRNCLKIRKETQTKSYNMPSTSSKVITMDYENTGAEVTGTEYYKEMSEGCETITDKLNDEMGNELDAEMVICSCANTEWNNSVCKQIGVHQMQCNTNKPSVQITGNEVVKEGVVVSGSTDSVVNKSIHTCANQVQVQANGKPMEALEIVSELLESMIIKASSKIKTSDEVPATVSDNYLQLNMSTVHEVPEVINEDITKSSIRRSTRQIKSMKQGIQVDLVGCDETSQCSRDRESELIASKERYKEMLENIKKRERSLMNRRRNPTIRGQILIDTTRRLGKKDLIPMKNFIVFFRIHKPFKHVVGEKGARPGKCVQEIQILNYQSLGDLRRKIFCEGDYQDTEGDVSDWPYSRIETIAKNKYKSGMFYIDNTFYVDTQEGAEDYSEGIRKWGEGRGIQLGPTVPMDDMKIEDLEVRFGYPYVYKHQGGCEHLIIISDARLLTPKDSLHSSDYPNITKTSRSLVHYCQTCSQVPARWIVTGTDRLPHDYNLLCHYCHQSFNYIGTEKVGNFKAYKWRQRALLYH